MVILAIAALAIVALYAAKGAGGTSATGGTVSGGGGGGDAGVSPPSGGTGLQGPPVQALGTRMANSSEASKLRPPLPSVGPVIKPTPIIANHVIAVQPTPPLRPMVSSAPAKQPTWDTRGAKPAPYGVMY